MKNVSKYFYHPINLWISTFKLALIKRETVLHMAETEEILRLLLRRSDLNVNIQDSHGQHLFISFHIVVMRIKVNHPNFIGGTS